MFRAGEEAVLVADPIQENDEPQDVKVNVQQAGKGESLRAAPDPQVLVVPKHLTEEQVCMY